MREQGEQAPGARKEWSSGENQEGHIVLPGMRAGREQWESWGISLEGEVGALSVGLRTRALLCGQWVTTEGFGRIHLAVVCREE